MSRPREFETVRASRVLCLMLTGVGLVLLGAMALAGAHPYERWAAELGIDMNVSYDGTRVVAVEEGEVRATERRAPGKMYTEIQVGGMTSGVILREDLGKSFILMPSVGFYREESLEGGLMQTSNGLEFTSIEPVGRDAVNGHEATRYQTQFSDNDGKGTGTIWVTDSGVAIKMDMVYAKGSSQGERVTTEFTELNLRPQDPQYFEVPAGLKPMGMGNMAGLGALLGNAAGQAAGAPAQPPAADLAGAQQACLQNAAQDAQAQQQTKRGLGRLLSAASRVTQRFGGPDLSQTTQDVYAADATAADIQGAARDLGISEDAVERCRNP